MKISQLLTETGLTTRELFIEAHRVVKCEPSDEQIVQIDRDIATYNVSFGFIEPQYIKDYRDIFLKLEIESLARASPGQLILEI